MDRHEQEAIFSVQLRKDKGNRRFGPITGLFQKPSDLDILEDRSGTKFTEVIWERTDCSLEDAQLWRAALKYLGGIYKDLTKEELDLAFSLAEKDENVRNRAYSIQAVFCMNVINARNARRARL